MYVCTDTVACYIYIHVYIHIHIHVYTLEFEFRFLLISNAQLTTASQRRVSRILSALPRMLTVVSVVEVCPASDLGSCKNLPLPNPDP